MCRLCAKVMVALVLSYFLCVCAVGIRSVEVARQRAGVADGELPRQMAHHHGGNIQWIVPR